MKKTQKEIEIEEFQERLNDLRDAKLLEIINDKNSYQELFWSMAVDEAKKRGLTFDVKKPVHIEEPLDLEVTFDSNESMVIEQVVPETKEPSNKEPGDTSNLPFLYSEKAIFTFSWLFTPIAGALLFRSNLKRLKVDDGGKVLTFGIIYTFVLFVVVNVLPIADRGLRSFGYLFSFVGGLVINIHYAVKYYPENLQYNKRPVWKQFIIGLVICIIIAFGLIKINQAIEKSRPTDAVQYENPTP